MNTYCWVHGTYTMKDLKMDQVSRPFTAAEKSYFDRMGHTGTAHPGIATSDPAKNYKVYHTYYQWVGFILFFQVGSLGNLQAYFGFLLGHFVLPSASPLENY